MRTAITLGRLHGDKEHQIVCGPEIPVDEQIRAAKSLVTTAREHPDYAEVQVWTSDSGCVKRLRFSEPKPQEPESAE